MVNKNAFIVAGDYALNQYDITSVVRDPRGVTVQLRNKKQPLRITGTAAMDMWRAFILHKEVCNGE